MTGEQFRESIGRWGLCRSLFVCLMLALRKYAGLNVCRVFVRDCLSSPRATALPAGIRLKVLGEKELLSAAADPELDLDSEFVHDALARRDIAFGAYDGDRLVGYTWRAFSCAPYVDGLWVRVDAPYHYGYKAVTRRAYRGRHILPALARLADEHCVRRGHKALALYVDVTNVPSLRLQARLGSRAVGYAGHLRWLGHSIPFRTPAVSRIGFHFEPRQERLVPSAGC